MSFNDFVRCFDYIQTCRIEKDLNIPNKNFLW